DLYTEDTNFVFGLAAHYDGVTVQSVFRFRSLSSVAERQSCIRRVLLHELGHILGMAADPQRINTIEALGNHCTVPGCTMRQGMSVLEWRRWALEEDQLYQRFCSLCLHDMQNWPQR